VSGFLKSKGDARRAIKQNALKVNKEGAKDGDSITADALLKETYLLLQRGKKSYFIVKAV
jgi:tyrosyl-tRNA synthetase